MHGPTDADRRRTVSRRRLLRGGGAVVGGAAVTGVGGATGDGGDAAGDRGVETDDALRANWSSEVRAIYASPKWYWDGGRPETDRLQMRQWLDRAEEAGLNTIFPWIESDGLASLLGEPLYAESDGYDFWNPERGWDPLGELVAGAHDRGMEVHLWYSFARYKRSSLPIPEYNPDTSVLPAGDPNWASVRLGEWEDGYRDPSHPKVGGQAVCITEVGTHDWTFEVLGRAFDAYPELDGLHIEEPGYLASDRCVCHRCQRRYAELYDDDPENLLDHTYHDDGPYYDDGRAIEVRCAATDSFVRKLDGWWGERGDGRPLSFNGSWAAMYDRIRGRNWVHWSEQGWLPHYFPQIYTTDVGELQSSMEAAMANLARTFIVPILGLNWHSGRNHAQAVAEQIRRARSLDGHADTPVGGAALFSGAELTPELVARLRAGPYRQSSSHYWSDGDGSQQSRGDDSVAEMRAREPLSFTPHWREYDRPGEYAGPPPGSGSAAGVADD